MSPLLISIAAFFAVAALVGGVALLLRSDQSSRNEDRLALLTANKAGGAKNILQDAGVLSQPLSFKQGAFAEFLGSFRQISLLFVQADTSLTPSKFCIISGVMGVSGSVAAVATGLNPAFIPVFFVLAGLLPLFWLLFRRRRRLRAFGKQLPDALELIARALRAGHSLSAGFNLVAGEMKAPIGIEFQRCYEEQNLGISLDEALKNLTNRVPNLDLKFFCTALVLQRQTGGDLAEILDKIGSLVRERFRIWGQVQALTGEGRLSGIVLLALPPVLFATVYYLNPDYVTVLFTDPIGKKMLAGGVVMQILGALVIRKIVNIKV
ncbi:MAG TPA: type II secretion system F family protein [Pirellulales bacterium]|jgi:tight adherence protein B|nr:type II secretion system F family protein [Pirellulales bacterium]